MHNMPMVIHKKAGTERAMDLGSILHEERTIFICNQVDEALANIVVSQLLTLAHNDPKKDINMYICSPGGSVVHGLAIYDAMHMIAPKVNTYCLGQCASMGAFLLSGGTGKRMAQPSSRIMIHQPLGGAEGQASDIEITANEIIRLKKFLNTEIAKHTGKTYEEIVRSTDRDNFMSAEEAVAFGLIDEVGVSSHSVDRR
ncbi:ATP-dependent Clp protease proteolytic subunit [Vibrio chagasii]|nr:ATP-dependent Clp protease proteolytic subunit [Vibrio chagasii]